MLTIFHNSRCSKSREALAYLESINQPVEVVFYLETPPDSAKIHELVRKLGCQARQLLRDKEELYLQLGLADPSLTEQQLIDTMAQNPRLIERPIIEWPDKAVIARPLALLQAEFA